MRARVGKGRPGQSANAKKRARSPGSDSEDPFEQRHAELTRGVFETVQLVPPDELHAPEKFTSLHDRAEKEGRLRVPDDDDVDVAPASPAEKRHLKHLRDVFEAAARSSSSESKIILGEQAMRLLERLGLFCSDLSEDWAAYVAELQTGTGPIKFMMPPEAVIKTALVVWGRENGDSALPVLNAAGRAFFGHSFTRYPAHAGSYMTVRTYLNGIRTSVDKYTQGKYTHKFSETVADRGIKGFINELKARDDNRQAPAFDIRVDGEHLHKACMHDACWSFPLRVRNWAWFLFAFALMGRASDVTDYCPDIEDIVIPERGSRDWPEGEERPDYIEVVFWWWKARHPSKRNIPYKMRLWRNALNSTFCPVFWVLLHLGLQGKRSGPIFCRHPNKTKPRSAKDMAAGIHVDAARPAAFQNMFMTMCEHAAKRNPALLECTSHSIRRSACQWAAFCGAPTHIIRLVGRWRTALGAMLRYIRDGSQAARDEGEISRQPGVPPMEEVWIFRQNVFGQPGEVQSAL